jgi:hypothetical protein
MEQKNGSQKCPKEFRRQEEQKKNFFEKLKYKFQIIKLQYISISNFDIIRFYTHTIEKSIKNENL